MGKKRIEIRLDTETDKDLINYLEEHTENMAGYIKKLLRNHISSVQGELKGVITPSPANIPLVVNTEEKEELKIVESPNTGTKPKRLPPAFHKNAMSGKEVTEKLNRLEN